MTRLPRGFGAIAEGGDRLGEHAEYPPDRVRAAPLASSWTSTSRWPRVHRSVVQNALEARTLVAAARHICRSQRNWDKKFWFLTDNMVSLGALSKGRNNSGRLLRVCRRWAALQFAFGIRVYLRHVPTGISMADGPSRGLPVRDDDDDQVHPIHHVTCLKRGTTPYRGQG